MNGVLGIDWWESSGCLEHSIDVWGFVEQLDKLQKLALQQQQPVPAPFGDGCFLVHETGMGTGGATRFRFRLEYMGATIGLSERRESSRQLPNFYIKISGEPCVIHGAEVVRARILTALQENGFVLTDEWFRRLDICLDLPGWSWEDTFAGPCEAKQYLGTGRKTAPHRDGYRTTGFTVRSCGRGLVIYDKLEETFSKKSEPYRLAMIQNRWGGEKPESATRIEYQVKRSWLKSRGWTTTASVIDKLGGLIAEMTKFDGRPFFILTDRVPDRKNRHQDRVEPHPAWQVVVQLMQSLAGEPLLPPKPLERQPMAVSKATKCAMSYVITVAAQLGISISGREDLVLLFDELIRRSGIPDDAIAQRWDMKARRTGAYREVTSFPFGVNQAI